MGNNAEPLSKQTFRVTASPRERFALARLFLNRALKFKDRGKERSLYRVRKALGLMSVSEYLLLGNGVGELWRDKTTRNVFTVTLDNAEFIVATMGELEKEAGESFMLEELAEQLEAKRDAEDADACAPPDLAAEEPLWKPSLAPSLEDPVKFVAVFLDTLRGDQSFGAWQRKVIKAFEPPKEEPGGALEQLAAAS